MEREVDCNHLSIPHYPIRGRAVPDHSTAEPVHYKSLAFLGFAKYRVGSDGSIWSCWKFRWGTGRWRKLKGNPGDARGHRTIILCEGKIRKRFYIHRLVLLAFVGPCPEGMEACHNNGRPEDNRLSNLRWGTRSENHLDKRKHGTSAHGERNPQSKLPEQEVKKIVELFNNGSYRQSELAAMFKVCKQTINNIVHGKQWKYLCLQTVPPNKKNSLTRQQAIEIKRRALGGERPEVIAKDFGVSRSTVREIRDGETWKNLSVDPPSS